MYVIIQLHKRKGRCGARADLLCLWSVHSSRVSNDVHFRAKLPKHCLPLFLECRPHREQEPKKVP